MNDVSSETRSPVIASWVLLIGTCLLSLIPFLGFLSWILGSATILIAFVLGIVVISKGGTWQGVFILLAAIIVVPVFIMFAPIVTSLITGAVMAPKIEVTPEAIGETKDEPALEAATEADDKAIEAPEAVPAKTDAPSAEEESSNSTEPVKGDGAALPGSPESQ